MKFIFLRKFLLLIMMFSFLTTTSYSQTKKTFTLVIDAGHGGHDSGTTGNNKYKKYEKDVALKIVIKLGKLVEKYMSDVNVIYTRKTDVFIKLIDRPKIANNNNADLFISVHCNANNKKSINGSETYVLGTHQNNNNFNVAKKENSVIYLEDDYSVNYAGFDPNSMGSIVGLTLGQEQYLENSLLLASLVQTNFKNKTELRSRGSNGVKQAGFWVLARNSMPSILVEAGFLSNDKDAKYLMSERGTYEVANALFLGFKEYKKFWDEQGGMNYDLPDKTNEELIIEKNEVAKVEASKVEESKVEEVVVVKPEPIPTTKKVEAKSTVAMMVNSNAVTNNADSKTKISTPIKVEKKKSIPVKVKTKEQTPKSINKIEYAVQLLSSKSKISLNDKTFKGLTKISYYKYNSIYKYIYNKNISYNKVLSSRRVVNSKGFKGSFVVAFKNGKRISLKDALKQDKNR